MNGLKLYSREVCPLCDEAEAMLLEAGVDATHVFVEDSLPLLERYGHRVPFWPIPAAWSWSGRGILVSCEVGWGRCAVLEVLSF